MTEEGKLVRTETVEYADRVDLLADGARPEVRTVRRDFWEFPNGTAVIEIEAEIWVAP